VLTIIGLLIGGTLKGQNLMQNARVTSTVTQVKAIETATTVFRDTYDALPGDMIEGDIRIPKCNIACFNAAPGAGDGAVGDYSWNLTASKSASLNPAGAALSGNPANAGETVLFWVELANAGLVTGVNADGINNKPPAFGGSLLAAKIGGGFWVGNSDANQAGLGNLPVTLAVYDVIGTILALVPSSSANISATAGAQVLTVSIAAQMDRKIDDGLPGFGLVQAYGVSSSCYNTTLPAPDTGIYMENVKAKNCGLYFQIQN
jgi:hypothetical protein